MLKRSSRVSLTNEAKLRNTLALDLKKEPLAHSTKEIIEWHRKLLLKHVL